MLQSQNELSLVKNQGQIIKYQCNNLISLDSTFILILATGYSDRMCFSYQSKLYLVQDICYLMLDTLLIVKTPTQPQFNITLVLLDKKMTLHTTPPTHYPPRKINMSNISAVTDPILINFKCRLLGTSRKDSNSHGDICPGNICPGDICTYQEYLSCY